MFIKWKVVSLALPVVLLAACKDEPTAPLQRTQALAAARSHDPTADSAPFAAGFTHFVFHDASRVNRPIAVAVWYPVERTSVNASTPGAQYPLDIFAGALPTATSADYEDFGIGRAYEEPAAAPGRHPLVVFSMGGGMTYDEYAFLGPGLAGHGIVVAVLAHWGDGYSGSPGEPLFAWEEMVYHRPRDMSRALDVLLERNGAPGDLLAGTIDPQRVYASGHSIGGYAAMALAAGDDLACDVVDPAIAVPYTCAPTPPDPRFGSIIPLDGSNLMLKFSELARVHVPAMGIAADSNRTAIAMSIPGRQHVAFQGHPNYRVDVHNPVADPMAYHVAFSSTCASLGVYQKYPEMLPLWGDYQWWLDWWCPADALPAQEMYRIMIKYYVGFISGTQPILTPGYALTSEPGVAFFVTEPSNPKPTGGEDPAYRYFVGQPGAATAQAAKDPPHQAPVSLRQHRH